MSYLVIPEALQRFTNRSNKINLPLTSLSDLANILKESYSDLYNVIFSEGKLKAFVRLYINGQYIESLSNSLKVTDDTEIEILVAVSGG